MVNDSKKSKQLNKIRKIKRICLIILVVEVFSVIAASSYAWFVYAPYKSVQSVGADVEKLINLNLLDDTATQPLQLFAGNLYPGQKNTLVLCISNNPMDGTNRHVSDIEYELKLAYTGNLPIEYSLYPLTKVTKNESYDITIPHSEPSLDDTYFEITADDTGNKSSFSYVIAAPTPEEEETQAPEAGSWVNEPVYQVYSDNFELAMVDDKYDEDYYLLEIKMPTELPEGIVLENIKKEVDMVYIIASIKQLQ